jgi:hypothetical protein
MDKMYNAIEKFIIDNKNSLLPRSQWFYPTGIDVYLRIGKQRVDKEIKLVVTVSNVTNSENPDAVSQGHFRSLMQELESIVAKLPEVEGILFENVIAPRLGELLLRNSYTVTNEVLDGLLKIYYKEIK